MINLLVNGHVDVPRPEFIMEVTNKTAADVKVWRSGITEVTHKTSDN